MDNASEGMLDTSDVETGMILFVDTGTLVLSGHKLLDSEFARRESEQLDSPSDVCFAAVKSQIESTLTVSENTDIHHQALILDRGISSKMKQHSHIILVISSIEASDVDEAVTETVSIVASVQRRSAIVSEVQSLAIRIILCDPQFRVTATAERRW